MMDQREFVKQIMRYQNRIYRFALSLVANYSDAEEILNQTIVTLWEKWQKYESNSEFLPWAFGIARNHVRNHFRKRSRREEQIGLSEAVVNRVCEVQSKNGDIWESRRSALGDCLGELKPVHRAMIEDYYDGAQTVVQLGQKFKCSVEAFYKTLQRVRKMLFDCINRKVAAESG